MTSQTLSGVSVEQQKLLNENGIWRAYVLMSLPIGAANQALMAKIKANQALYARFRSSKAFDELNAEVQSLEAQRQK